MNAALTVLLKESLDGLRERRAILGALLFGPLMGPAMLAGIIAFTVDRALDESEQPIEIPIVGAPSAPNLVRYLAGRGITRDDAVITHEALRQAVREGSVAAGVVIAEDFGEALSRGTAARVWIVTDTSNNRTMAQVRRLETTLAGYGQTLGALRLVVRGIDPTLTRPIAVLREDLSTPAGRSILLLGMMTYFLLFATFMGGLHIAIDGTAGERERGSLEPLLSLPCARHELVIGKLAAAALFMTASMALSAVSFTVCMSFLPLGKIGMSASLTPAVCAEIIVVMLPFALFGSAAMTAVASFSKSFREAQTWTGLAMLLPTLPIAFAAMNPMQPSFALMWIPSLSQHLLITGLIKGEGLDPLFAAASALGTLAFALAAALLVVRRYRSEKLLL